MKKILMFSHNPSRDSMCDSMLEQVLSATKGNVVWSRNFLDDDFDAICKIKPDIIILPEIRVEYSQIMATQFKEWGGKVVVKMCEMGVTKDAISDITEEYRDAIYGNIDAKDIVDLVLAFSEPQKKLYCQYSGMPKEKVLAIGAMQFDPYFTNLPEVPKKQKPRILFATGFSYADRNPEYALPEGKAGQKLHVQKVMACRMQRANWLKTIPLLHTMYGDAYDFALRPHAGERRDSYDEMLKPYVTISDIPTGILDLHASDILVHAGSTMGIEAHITDTPGICMFPVSQDPVVTTLHPRGDTLEDFAKIMSSIELGKSNVDKRMSKKLKSYYEPLDGKAHIRAAEAISAIEVGPTKIPKKWPEFSHPRFLDDPDVIPASGQWFCSGCKKTYVVRGIRREMVKCPYCGIANVRTRQADPRLGAPNA